MRVLLHRRLFVCGGDISRLRTVGLRCFGRRRERFWQRKNDAGNLSLRRRQHGLLLFAGGEPA
jgi:hypothetical protein